MMDYIGSRFEELECAHGNTRSSVVKCVSDLQALQQRVVDIESLVIARPLRPSSFLRDAGQGLVLVAFVWLAVIAFLMLIMWIPWMP